MGYTEDTLKFYTKIAHEYVMTWTIHFSSLFLKDDLFILCY